MMYPSSQAASEEEPDFSQFRMMEMAHQMRAALLYKPNFPRLGSESSLSSVLHASSSGGNSLSPGGSESSGSQCGGASPPSAKPTFFRPWLSTYAHKTPKTEPLFLAPTHMAPISRRGSGSRNSDVVPVEATALVQHQSALEALATRLGRDGHSHRCIYCGKVYSRKYGLKIHLRTHSGFKPLKCRICHRTFGDPSNLNKHTRLHKDATNPSHP